MYLPSKWRGIVLHHRHKSIPKSFSFKSNISIPSFLLDEGQIVHGSESRPAIIYSVSRKRVSIKETPNKLKFYIEPYVTRELCEAEGRMRPWAIAICKK